MVEKFTGYRTSNGTVFDTERDAWKQELFLKLMPHAENACIATKIANALADDPSEIRAILAKLDALTPRTADAEA